MGTSRTREKIKVPSGKLATTFSKIMSRFKRNFHSRFGLSYRFQKCNNNDKLSNIENIFLNPSTGVLTQRIEVS